MFSRRVVAHEPVQVREIPRSAHFFFYDEPVATFRAIGDFVHAR